MQVQDFSGKRLGRYLFSSPIGAGVAGTVYRAIDTTMGNLSAFAIKCIPKSRSAGRLHKQIAEIDNHSVMASCKHIIKLYDIFETDGHFFLVLSYCETDLFRVVWKRMVFWRNDDLIKEAFVEILDGVSACHSKGIFHRDLKPENIMCNANGRNMVIGDFGLSTDRGICRDGRCGTNSYMSPECWEEGLFYYAKPVDIWSLGVVLFNMVTCRYPWEEARATDKDFVAFLSEKDYLLRNYAISEPLSVLLRRIWHPTPRKRLSIPTIRRAVLEMKTFYMPHLSRSGLSYAASPSLMEVMVDSQQTCVAPAEGDKSTGKLSCCN